MHEVIATVPPATALAVGLKVDVEALAPEIIAALQAGEVDLANPAVTVELLRLNGVVVPFLHDPGEVGMDPAYALRTATGKYRTTPLRGLWQHPPYFHDGSAPDLLAVVNHYDQLFGLNLTAAQKADLVEFLESL